MTQHTVRRYHDISCGHRVHGHESKCQHLHGHNYRVHFVCQADQLDGVGRVIDFSVVKDKLCMWLEDNWDHKFLAWDADPVMTSLACVKDNTLLTTVLKQENNVLTESIVFVPFNPTAENMAAHLVDHIGPQQLDETGVRLVEVIIEETAKCHASYKSQPQTGQLVATIQVETEHLRKYFESDEFREGVLQYIKNGANNG